MCPESKDLATFRELKGHAPSIICPECGEPMQVGGMLLGNTNLPVHEIEYECWQNIDCATRVELELRPDFSIIRAKVSTANHGYQEMYDLIGGELTEIFVQAAAVLEEQRQGGESH